jgi:xanthine dehydrogenase small subunit
VRRPDELIKTVRIPLPLAELSAFHKIAKRRFDDISSIAVAFALRLNGDQVSSVRIGLGGVAATPLRAGGTEELLTGQRWTREVVAAAAESLAQEGTPLDDHRASAGYRTAMLRQALLKFHAETAGPLSQEVTR